MLIISVQTTWATRFGQLDDISGIN